MELVLLFIAALLCGAGNKYADLFNEHGLRKPYAYADIVWGVIWGIAGMVLVYANSAVALTYIGTTLYWFLRGKLEYFNHALAGVLILLGGFLFQSEYIMNHPGALVALFLAYTLTGYIQKAFKEHTTRLWWFWKIRLRIYLIPLVYSLIIHNFLPFYVTLVAMIGNEIVRYHFKEYENDSSLTPVQQQQVM